MNFPTQRIAFPIQRSNGSMGVALITPTGEIPVLEVARKDVPANVPYLIIEYDDLPEMETFFEAWECDFSNPDGYGIGSEAWFAEKNGQL